MKLEITEFIDMDELERRYMIELMRHFEGNTQALSLVLNVCIKTLYCRLAKHGIPRLPPGRPNDELRMRRNATLMKNLDEALNKNKTPAAPPPILICANCKVQIPTLPPGRSVI